LNFRIILFVALGFFLFNSLIYSHPYKKDVELYGDEPGDSTRKSDPDSAREARSRIADSLKDARAHTADSMKLARKKSSDSLKTARKHISDSSAAVRKYHNGKYYKDSITHARNHKADSVKMARQSHTDSLKGLRANATDSSASVRKYHSSKHYKDSVARARNNKTETLKMARQGHMDSLNETRQHSTDSMMAFRKVKTDSIKKIQKKRTDSLAKIKKYKASKRYTDSVSLVRSDHLDSVRKAQQAYRERMASIRKHSMDSAKAVRKHTMDSTKLVRTKHLDSIKLVRKARTDSLAKIKAEKERIAKAKEKKKEDAMKIKLELKMKQKHEAWSNKQMLKKRWSPFRRFLQNSFTHYNYYYNANKKMEEAQVNMQRSRKENYDSLIGLYPFDPNRDSGLLSADMDTIIRKVSVGIQIHDPRVKWSNDMYLILGEAYYYRGKYNEAAISFRYIISEDEEKKKKEAAGKGYGNAAGNSNEAPSIIEDEKKSRLDFLKHKSVHNESILWLARTYTEARQPENAESVLSLLESDAKFPDNLKGRLAIEKAFAYLNENNFVAASPQLMIAEDDDNLPYWLRMRSAFINGQLLQNMGDYKGAAGSFEKVLTYYPKVEMDFYSRKYIAFNRLQQSENIDDATRPLKKVLNDGKYVNYYDQVYYVLGQLAAKGNDNDKAISYFTKSTTTPKATKKQKALSYSALGDVYYATSDYPSAKMAYDSAAKYSSSASKDNSVAAALQRSKGLEEVLGPTKVIHDQDSLMALSALSKKEQLSAVRRYLRILEQQQEDSIANSSAVAAVPVAPADDNPDAASWYFGNTALMTQGSADFKKKWGTRPLTDNWRRAASISVANSSGGDDDEPGENGAKDNGMPTEASLLAKIPNTPPQKELSAKVEQRAYIVLAKAYMKQLEDYNQANLTLDTLDYRFPNHNQKEEELYLRYQIALKQNKLDKAQAYSQELIAKFPESEYANSMRPKKSESKMEANTTGKTVNAYFDETYNLLLAHQYTEALMHVDIAKRQFDNPSYKKRFEVAEAMGYAGTGDYNQADSVITKFLKAYPADTLTPWASTVKEYIKEVRNGGKPSWYKEGVATTGSAAKTTEPVVAKPKATAPTPPPDIPAAYSYHPEGEHYCIIVLPGIDSRTAGLKKAIKDLNADKYSSFGLDLLFDLYNIDQGVIVIKKFGNADTAKRYMNDLLASAALQNYLPEELKVLVITANNYKKMFADKTVQPYLTFYSGTYE